MLSLLGNSLFKILGESFKEVAKSFVTDKALFTSAILPFIACPISLKDLPKIPHLALILSTSFSNVLNIVLFLQLVELRYVLMICLNLNTNTQGDY